MRAKSLFLMAIAGLIAIFIAPAITTGQPGGGKKSFGSFGDPGSRFDSMANGRASIAISEIKGFGKDFALQYAQDRGISNGQFTRSQYIEFSNQLGEQMKARFSGGGAGGDKGGKKGFEFPGGGNPDGGGFGKGKKGFGGGDPGAFPGGGNSQTTPPSPDIINQLADADFKRRDNNDDGKLNIDEMPDSLRRSLVKWDKSNDGLINRDEYREYFASRLGGGNDDSKATSGIASILIDEDELDRKTVVFRAGGKVPPGLPSWFKELEVDGQVPLYSWRGAKKSHDEFKTWDINDDGLITMEEAMKVQQLAKGGPRTNGGPTISISSVGDSSSERPSFGGNGWSKKGGGGPPGGGPPGGGDFGKKKRGFGGN